MGIGKNGSYAKQVQGGCAEKHGSDVGFTRKYVYHEGSRGSMKRLTIIGVCR